MENNIICLQYGATPHWALVVRQQLDEIMSNRCWMGRGSQNMSQPPFATELTMCAFFLWAIVKFEVYDTGPSCIGELQQQLKNIFSEIGIETCGSHSRISKQAAEMFENI